MSMIDELFIDIVPEDYDHRQQVAEVLVMMYDDLGVYDIDEFRKFAIEHNIPHNIMTKFNEDLARGHTIEHLVEYLRDKFYKDI